LAYARLESNHLVLGNQYLERRVVTHAGEPCVTTAFVNKTSGRDYARGGTAEFTLTANDRRMTAQDFTFARLEIREGDPVEAVVWLDGDELVVELHYQVYAAYPVLRKWLVARNRGAETITLANLDWENVNLLVDLPANAEVWADYITRREKAVAVTMDDCALLVNDTVRHEGLIVATEAPGPLKRLEVYARPERIAIGYNRDDETIFECILAPGEEFRTHAGFLLPFANSIPQDVIDGDYARFIAERLIACDVAQVPTITVNSWEPHGANINREVLLKEIEGAAEMGVDAYQVDDGWFDLKGDWNDDPAKFPNGLEEIADYVRARGMRFGLWMAVATVNQASRVCREHPEWIMRDPHGEPNHHGPRENITMCLDCGFYDFILAKIDSIIARYEVELLKLDLSAVRNLYAPGVHTSCYAANHTHRSPRESNLRILERLFDLLRALKARHPRCLLDVTYELYGVMDGADLALTQIADQDWFTNITSPSEVSLRREIYQRGRVTRPWTLNFGGARLDHPNAPRYGLFSALTAHGLFWGNLSALAAETRAYYRRWFEWAKAERTYSDFYRYYLVSDVFPPPDGLSSRDYRHAIPTPRYGIVPRGVHPPAFEPLSEYGGEAWDGVARLNPRGEGPIFIFRPANSREEKFQLRVPWVEGESLYRVTDVTEAREVCTCRGAELIEPGLELTLAQPSSAKVIVLRCVMKEYS
jgi:alpha-galactosidase